MCVERMAEAEFETDSSVRGYHVYQDNWTPIIGGKRLANGRKKIHEIDMQWPLEMQWPPCDRHGIMIKFSSCEEGKLSMVKLSRFAKIPENRESFPLQMF